MLPRTPPHDKIIRKGLRPVAQVPPALSLAQPVAPKTSAPYVNVNELGKHVQSGILFVTVTYRVRGISILQHEVDNREPE